MKNKCKAICSLILAAAMLLSLTLPVLALEGEEEVIRIQSAEDLLKLSESCRMDSWSVGKQVVLEADISLAGASFAPIPTFGGTFDGNGHTISGLELRGSASPVGLFGVLQETAVVRNLTLQGVIAPGGDAALAGGIAGENYGIIQDCSFDGTVTGSSDTGGIVGLNGSTGCISGCAVSGTVIGKNRTGGIAGQNLGIITGAQNTAQVNTVSVDPSINLEELGSDLLLDITKWTSLDTSVSAMDTGGIAGYNSGSLLSCVNRGEIGYPHVGYNVGGIAGRSCGFISGCENSALILGRKDIGGIAGQMEPNVALELSDDTVGELKKELEDLQTLLTDLKNSGVSAAGSVNLRIDTILTYLDGASRSAENLGQAAGDYAASVTDEFNRVSLVLSDVLKRLEEISGQVTALSDTVAEGLSQLETAMEEFAKAAELTEEAMGCLNAAMGELENAKEDTELAMAQISAGLDSLRNALSQEDEEAIRAALTQIQQGFTDLSAAAQKAADAVGTINGLIGDSGAMPEEVLAAADALKTALEECAAALKTIAGGVADLPSNPKPDTEALKAGIQSIRSGISSLSSALGHLEAASGLLKSALEKGAEASGRTATALNALADAMGTFSRVSSQMGRISENIEALLASVNGSAPVQIPQDDGQIQANAENLFANVNSMSDELKSLNAQLNAYGLEAVEKMDAISAKFESVVKLLLEIAGQTLNPDTDNVFNDTSDADIESVTAGKLYGCVNSGTVEGDLNVGGITGTMAIEYELDPEDDLTASTNGLQQRVYEMKAIAQNCANSGTVIAKRSYAGGIVGQMNLGLAYGCENYGAVSSENGDYVGGIAGITGAKIRSCFVKCTLSGRKYVGGIAGSGVAGTLGGAVSSVCDCFCMVEIAEGTQYLGAISGGKAGNFSGNFFVSDVLAGINGISYASQAEPISYKTLLELSGLPDNFRKLTVSFTADGETIRTVLVDYGQSLEASMFPAIPQKDGYFAAWERTELTDIRFDTVLAVVYTPHITALPGEEERTNGRPIFFLEGAFDSDAVLKAESVPSTEADFSQIPTDFADTLVACFTSDRLYRGVVEQWILTIPDDGTGSHTVRYLAPSESTKNLAVFLKENGQWKQIDTQALGTYLAFTASGTEAEIAILSTMPVWWVWLIPLALILLIAALIGKLIGSIRRRKNAAARQKEEDHTAAVEAELQRLREEVERLKAEKEGTASEE
ncbi:MAG: hypothetical protein ACI4PO_07540 [Faecousia sp.]